MFEYGEIVTKAGEKWVWQYRTKDKEKPKGRVIFMELRYTWGVKDRETTLHGLPRDKNN